MRSKASAPQVLLALALLVLAGCTAAKLRSHNIELESLLSTRAEAMQAFRTAVRDSSPSVLEQERRLEQVKADLAELAFDAMAAAQDADDKATKVGYLFTAARAGSKASGPILAEVFETRIAASKEKEGKADDQSEPSADQPAEEDPVDPFYFGIVVPARVICASFENTWEKPARDCAYIEVVGYFAAIDEIVRRAQHIEDAGDELSATDLERIESAFDDLSQQFNNVEETARTVISTTYDVDSDFLRYLDLQLLRTYCSADTVFLAFENLGDAGAAAQSAREAELAAMSDYLKRRGASTLQGFVFPGGGPDCAAAADL